jgi:small multidrug resistance pump
MGHPEQKLISHMPSENGPGEVAWHGSVLKAAAVYNMAWGFFAIVWPLEFFRWCGVDPLPNYPELWQCIGMIVGVYGVGYWIAASDSVRHWPIVLVGLLGKILGPIGFAQAVINERFPLKMGVTILFNDLIWWVPFAMILLHVRTLSLFAAQPQVVEEPPELKPISASRRTPSTAIVWSSLKSASGDGNPKI